MYVLVPSTKTTRGKKYPILGLSKAIWVLNVGYLTTVRFAISTSTQAQWREMKRNEGLRAKRVYVSCKPANQPLPSMVIRLPTMVSGCCLVSGLLGARLGTGRRNGTAFE